MTTAEVISAAHHAGLVLLADGADLVVKPADRITVEVRALLLDAKAEVIEYLQACERITPMLLDAAMRACDHHEDGEAAREAMRADCLATPLHQRLELLDHFQQTYGAYA